MEIYRPKHVSRDIGAPKDWDPAKDGACDVLPVVDHSIQGRRFMRSHWRPSPAEMAALDAGGTITLDIEGGVHPVVAVGVEPGAIIPLESASRRIAIAIGAAVEAMLETARKTSPGAFLAVSPCQVDGQGAGVRWGLVKDPKMVAEDFAHWSLIGPIDAEGSDPLPDFFSDDLPKLDEFLGSVHVDAVST